MRTFPLLILSISITFSVFSQSKSQLNQLAVEAVYVQNYSKAIAYFSKVIELDPMDSIAYLDRAMTKELIWDLTGAIEDYTKQQKIVAECVDCFFLRGMLAEKMEDYRHALKDYRQVHQLEDGNADAHYFYGRIYLTKRKYSQALAAMNDAIRVNESHVNALLDKTWIQLLTNKNDEALNTLIRVRNIEPENPQLSFTTGIYFIKMGQLDSASYYLTQTHAIDPYFELPSHLEKSLSTLNLTPVKETLSVQLIHDNTPNKLVATGKIFLLLGDYTSAKKILENNLLNENITAQYFLGLAFYQLHDLDKAAKLFTKVTEHPNPTTNAYYYKAMCEYYLNQNNKACNSFKMYIQKNGVLRKTKLINLCLE